MVVADAFTALRLEASAYPLAVQIWMKIMAVSFFSGAIVAWWDRRAFWGAVMAVLTLAFLVLAKIEYPDLARETSGAVIHLGMWPLFALIFWRPVRGGHVIYRSWRIWVSTLISISLLLDVKTLIS